MGGPGSGRFGRTSGPRTGLSVALVEAAEVDDVSKNGLTWPDSELSFSPMRQLVTDWRPEQRDELNRARRALKNLGIDIVERSLSEVGTFNNQRHTYERVTRMELIRSLRVDRPIAVDAIAELYMKGANDTPHERKFARQKALVALHKLKQEGLVKRSYTFEGKIAYQLTSTQAYELD